MNVLADTSFLVAAMVEAHPSHERAQKRLQKLLSGNDQLLLCAHTLAELYAVLSRLPVSPRITPDMARRLIRENVEKKAKIVTLDAADYTAVLDRMTDAGIAGGVIYDALILRAAEKAHAGLLLTLNETDFRRVGPDSRIAIAQP